MGMISKKICLVGDFGVGKTSLIRRFVERQFSDQYLSTVGVKISRKTLELMGEKPDQKLNLRLMIWDLEGHTKFKGISKNHLQGASGALVVADLTRPETIENIPEHINLFLSINPKGIIIVALNKADLFTQEKLQKARQIKEFESILATYQTSAKNGLYVDEIFYQLACEMIKKNESSC
ncbi:MAG: GTP-binding protein [Symploca sp. SIO3C6]|uniref:GTP-binding protein n=1 Tax=Symploca sp. SIO1C4 TaxID=2607765 RepID=A0A6B3NGQ0_9CYAN|nr:GTP-binding protein [Symploca sp. SIO3C6]NER29722.1 GTP-binding protein [Symploca sp. SIO1C4]NET06074.1 GTP-binding protein [Symploca sp. SIO2B6]